MKKELFNIYIDKMKELRNICIKLIGEYNVSKMVTYNVKDLDTYYKQVQSAQSHMDNLICDFYHLIGMSDLSAAQTSQLSKNFKDVMHQRNQIKQIVGVKQHIMEIANMQQLSCCNKYKLKLMGVNKTIVAEEQ